LIKLVKMKLKKIKINKKNLKNIIFWINFIILTISLSFLAKFYVIDQYFSDQALKQARKIHSENRDKNIRDIYEKFKDLIAINPDIKGWIKIENTVIDYPVLQSSVDDPIFYLHKNYKKEKDINGSIFINSYYSVLDSCTQNTVLHGHSMRNGKMFAPILKYRNIDFLKKSPIITFDNIVTGFGKWKIFAFIQTNTDESHGEVFNYLVPNFDSDEDFYEFLYKIHIRSHITTDNKFRATDPILTLSTCSYEMKGFRTVVFARKIRPDEDENVNHDNMTNNPNPLMPKGWYDMKKRKMPTFDSYDEALKKGKIDWIDH